MRNSIIHVRPCCFSSLQKGIAMKAMVLPLLLLLLQVNISFEKYNDYTISVEEGLGSKTYNLEYINANFSDFEENNCTDVSQSSCCFLSNVPGAVSGVYTVEDTDVYCHMDGWMTTMRRSRNLNKKKFNQTWIRYTRKKGFGDLHHDHWKGLRLLHKLTQSTQTELQIKLWDSHVNDSSVYIYYDSFRVGGPKTDYKLTLGRYSGPEDLHSFNAHNNSKFITFDHDTTLRNFNCANIYGGGWWYTECFSFLPTGVAAPLQGIGLLSQYNSIEMKIRPKNCLII